MLNIVLVIFLFALLMATPTESWTHQMHVDHSGINDSSCWMNEKPCRNINLALAGLRNNSTVIYINFSNEPYRLSKGNETRLQYKSHVAIIGLIGRVSIECDNTSTGLSFENSYNIHLENVSLNGCDGTQTSTSTDFSSTGQYLSFQVSVYMLLCSNVSLMNVAISNTRGVGMTLYNVLEVDIRGSVFDNNRISDQAEYGGGGGLQIEFTACVPRNNKCTDMSQQEIDNMYTRNNHYLIENTVFERNQGSQAKDLSLYKAFNYEKQYYSFGRGGGLSAVFRDMCHGVTVVLNNVTLHDNIARYGAGFYVGFHGRAQQNSVIFNGATIYNNYNIDPESKPNLYWSEDGAGGGGKVMYSSSNYSYSNNVKFLLCNFTRNTAISGGGLSMEAVLTDKSANNVININQSNFTSNTGYLGSAISFSQQSSTSNALTTILSNIQFVDNTAVCTQTTIRTFASVPCSGTLYVNSNPLTLLANISFIGNKATALEVHGTIVSIEKDAKLFFKRNSGTYGGAIGLYDCSYLVLYSNTTLTFDNNYAGTQGGAIYSDKCTSNNQPTIVSSNCFIQYYNKTVNPEQWNVGIFFHNNIVTGTDGNTTNSIYTYDAIPCWWPNASDHYKAINFTHALKSTFCWDKWHYSPKNCSANVDSPPAVLTINDNSTVYVLPGGKVKLPIIVHNGNGIPINKDVHLKVCIATGEAFFSSTTNKRCKKAKDKEISVYRRPLTPANSTFFVTIDTTTVNPLQTSFYLQFKKCEWPYYLHNGTECSVDNASFCCSTQDNCADCSFQCNIDGTSYVQEIFGNCISQASITGKIVIVNGQCPLMYYNSRCTNVSQLESFTNCKEDRRGRLCGECDEGRGVPLNALYLECVTCKGEVLKGWLVLISLQFVPLTILVLLILVLKIDLTNGTVNGFVLFSQIISLQFPGWLYPSWTTSFWDTQSSSVVYNQTDWGYSALYQHAAMVTPYSIWNLNFLTLLPLSPHEFPVCIANNLGPLAAISFWYMIAFYPLLLMTFLSVWLVVYLKGYCITVTRPIHRKLARFWSKFNIEPSLVTSAASIYILCFTQFALTSLKLLNAARWTNVNGTHSSGLAFYYDGTLDYFHGLHGAAGCFAILILMGMVILPMICLICYPAKWFQKLLDKCRMRREFLVAFSDTFMGQFKNGIEDPLDCRYFGGLFLLFRLAVIGIFLLPYYTYSSKYNVLFWMQLVLTLGTAGAIMVIRPYKKITHNLTNFFLLLFLAFLSSVAFIPAPPRKFVFHCLVAAIYVPLVFILGYFVVQLCKKSVTHMRLHIRERDFSTSISSYPDRLVHPDVYPKLNVNVEGVVASTDMNYEWHPSSGRNDGPTSNTVRLTGSCHSRRQSGRQSAANAATPLLMTSSDDYNTVK